VLNGSDFINFFRHRQYESGLNGYLKLPTPKTFLTIFRHRHTQNDTDKRIKFYTTLGFDMVLSNHLFLIFVIFSPRSGQHLFVCVPLCASVAKLCNFVFHLYTIRSYLRSMRGKDYFRLRRDTFRLKAVLSWLSCAPRHSLLSEAGLILSVSFF
jgi:hypothetical protein